MWRKLLALLLSRLLTLLLALLLALLALLALAVLLASDRWALLASTATTTTTAACTTTSRDTNVGSGIQYGSGKRGKNEEGKAHDSGLLESKMHLERKRWSDSMGKNAAVALGVCLTRG